MFRMPVLEYKTLVRAVLAVALLVHFPASRASDDPRVLVETTIEHLRKEVSTNQETFKQNPAAAQEIVTRVVEPHLDMPRIARWVLGKHRRQASAQQQQEFVREFRELLFRVYSMQAPKYIDVKVDYLPVQTSDGGLKAVVPTRVIQSDGRIAKLSYRLHHKDGVWRLYDLAVDGISLLTTFRSAIESEIQRHGIDGVIAQIKDSNRGGGGDFLQKFEQ